MRQITLLVVLAVTPFTSVAAQASRLVRPGARVRLSAPDLGITKYNGSLVSVTRDTLTVDTLAVALASVTRLDVHRGRKSNTWKGAAYGFVAGAIPGAVLSYAGCASDPDPFIEIPPGVCAGLGVVLYGGIGAGIGAIVGALTRTDRWEEVPLDQLRVSFVPQRDGRFALGLSVAF